MNFDVQREMYRKLRSLFYFEKYSGYFDNFLKIFYIPTVRTPLKPVFIISDGQFNDADNEAYGGILNNLEFYEYSIYKAFPYKDIKDELLDHKNLTKLFFKICDTKIDILYLLKLCPNCFDDDYVKCREVIEIKIKEYHEENPDYSFNETVENIDNLNEEEKFLLFEDNVFFLRYTLNMINNENFVFLKELTSKSSYINWFIKHIRYDLIENNYNYYDEKLKETFDYKNKFLSILPLTNYWLNLLDFPFSLYVKKTNYTASLLVFKYDNSKDEFSDITYNASYESSGFQQLFPVLVNLAKLLIEAITVPAYIDRFDHKPRELFTLFIEQPELHLHPAVQSKLPDILKYYLRYSNGFNENHLFIETHSEHIIRKIQLLIAKGEISLNDVAVNYISSENNKSAVRHLRIAENGNFLDPWPDGFFDEAAELSYELLKAQINRSN